MNKKGQTVLISVVVAVFIFLFGVLFVDFIDMEAKNAAGTNSSLGNPWPNLNCGPSASPNQNVSDGTKLTCLATDAVVPYYILVILSISGGLIIGRLLR